MISAMADLKHLGRYLLEYRYVALRMDEQAMPTEIKNFVDSDRANGKSTTGLAMRFGLQTLKQATNLQSAIGPNVFECEFYDFVHGGAHSLGMQAYFCDTGIEREFETTSDNTNAKSCALREELGSQRHVQAGYLWIQGMVSQGLICNKKVAGDKNFRMR